MLLLKKKKISVLQSRPTVLHVLLFSASPPLFLYMSLLTVLQIRPIVPPMFFQFLPSVRPSNQLPTRRF